MEQTTLQQRIEERAKERLLKDLLNAATKEQDIANLIGSTLYPCKLHVYTTYDSFSSRREQIHTKGEFTKTVVDALLPQYVAQITDEILQKIDEIDYLVNANKELQEDLP